MTIYGVGHCLVRCFFRCMGGLEPVHEERVPSTGPLIVAANHVSFADPPAIGAATRRQLWYMAKQDLFLPGIGFMLRLLHAFPVARGTADIKAIRHAQALLRAEKAVLVFPEGTRGDGINLQRPSQGVALLAKTTGARIIPAAVVGTERFLPRGAKLPRRARISVIWGEPFTYEEAVTGTTQHAQREAFGVFLMLRIRALAAERGCELKMPWLDQTSGTIATEP